MKQVFSVVGSLLVLGLAAQAGIVLQQGQKVAFLGDSITQFGWHDDGGYVQLAADGLKDAGLTPEIIPAGVSGNKSNQMLERLEADVLSHSPDWLVLSCGVNDVGHGVNGVNLEDYRRNIRTLVETARKRGVKVMLLTSTMLGEDAANDGNRKLDEYNEFLRQLAREDDLVLVDLSADMHREVAEKVAAGRQAGTLLTGDGLHMNPLGNVMMARGVLRGFGFTDEQLAKLDARWEAFPVNPGYPYQLLKDRPITLKQYRELDAIAARRGGISAIQLLSNTPPEELEPILASIGVAPKSN